MFAIVLKSLYHRLKRFSLLLWHRKSVFSHIRPGVHSKWNLEKLVNYLFFLSQHCSSVSWFLVTRSAHFFPYWCCCWIGSIVPTSTFVPLFFATAFTLCSITSNMATWEKREPVIWVTPRAAAKGSCQVLESLGISCPLLAQSHLRSGCSCLSALGSHTCTCSSFIYCQNLFHCFVLQSLLGPSWLLSTLSLKNPGAPRYLCTHPWGVLSYSPHGEESPSTYRIKRRLFRLGKKKKKTNLSALQTVLVTSGTALALSYLLKTSSVWWKNKFSLSLSKRNSNSWFSG